MSPDRGHWLARNTRLRWALEETGPYEVHLGSFRAMDELATLRLSVAAVGKPFMTDYPDI